MFHNKSFMIATSMVINALCTVQATRYQENFGNDICKCRAEIRKTISDQRRGGHTETSRRLLELKRLKLKIELAHELRLAMESIDKWSEDHASEIIEAYDNRYPTSNEKEILKKHN